MFAPLWKELEDLHRNYADDLARFRERLEAGESITTIEPDFIARGMKYLAGNGDIQKRIAQRGDEMAVGLKREALPTRQ